MGHRNTLGKSFAQFFFSVSGGLQLDPKPTFGRQTAEFSVHSENCPAAA
jgi:hypothetical protein